MILVKDPHTGINRGLWPAAMAVRCNNCYNFITVSLSKRPRNLIGWIQKCFIKSAGASSRNVQM
jgi:hypothetical protein